MGQIFKTNGSRSDLTLVNYRNRLTNSAFDNWQVGTSTTVANGVSTYLADQWYARNALGTNGVLTYSQTTGVTAGSKYGAKVQITTAPTAAQANGCELVQTLSNNASFALYNQSISGSVLIKSFGNVTGASVGFYYKTTEGKVDTQLGSEFITSVNTSTFTLCSLPNQSVGTTPTTSGVIGIKIRITNVSSGNLYDLNNGFVVEQAMMNIGSSASSFSRQFDDPAAEMASCQYFFEKSYDSTVVPGTNVGTDGAGAVQTRLSAGLSSATFALRVPVQFKVSKRATPVMTGYSTDGTSAKFRDRTAAANINAAFQSTGLNGTVLDITANGAATAYLIEAHWTADSRI